MFWRRGESFFVRSEGFPVECGDDQVRALDVGIGERHFYCRHHFVGKPIRAEKIELLQACEPENPVQVMECLNKAA